MMKKTVLLALTLAFIPWGSLAEADERDGLVGHWLGILNVQGNKLRIGLNVEKEGKGFEASVDSVDQNVRGLPVQNLSCEKGLVKFSMNTIGAGYQGSLQDSGELIKGVWLQAGRRFPLHFKKRAKRFVLKRPQLPKKPYPYQSVNVEFSHKPGEGVAQSFLAKGTRGKSDRVTLSGTLTIPQGKGPFPAVVLVSGSGPNDRDETLMGHKPFLILSDYLSRRGIAVLRYDDRGVYQSTGNHRIATSRDFADDALAAIHFLKTRKELNQKQLGIIGHSEGGMIAPMAAVDCADIAFIVLLAGPGVNVIEVLKLQSQLLAKAEGVDRKELTRRKALTDALFDAAGDQAKSRSERRARIIAILRENFKRLPKKLQQSNPSPERSFQMQAERLLNPWFQFMFRYETEAVLKKVKCSVLALNGEKDLQVDPGQNLPAIMKALEAGGNNDYSVVKLPALNHLFQTSKTGAMSEYSKIEETFAPVALKMIGDWIEARSLIRRVKADKKGPKPQTKRKKLY